MGAHHERFDGTGYPRGSRGESIPLLGRILAVADAYSAMTTDRPYRKAMSHEEAKTELLRVAGTQLDPALVQAFLTALRETTPWPPRAGSRGRLGCSMRAVSAMLRRPRSPCRPQKGTIQGMNTLTGPECVLPIARWTAAARVRRSRRAYEPQPIAGAEAESLETFCRDFAPFDGARAVLLVEAPPSLSSPGWLLRSTAR